MARCIAPEPPLHPVATLRELQEVYTLDDVLGLNEALDIAADIHREQVAAQGDR